MQRLQSTIASWHRAPTATILALLWLLGASTFAHAQLDPSGPDDPCGASVTPARKEHALALKRQAFALHSKARFADAAPLYQRALKAWDHPEIRLALARVLFFEARLLEAHEHVSQALRCPQALDNDDERASARALLRRLESQLARIEVHSPDTNTEILFNGAPWFRGDDGLGPHKIVYPGQYEITAQRPGYITVRKPLTLASGERATLNPQLVSRRDATTHTRRWARWMPWLVTGTSVALLATSGGLQLLAQADFVDFDARWADTCEQGCLQSEQQDIIAVLNRAENELLAARITVVAGSLGLLTGGVLLLLNRPKAHIDESAGSAPVRIEPMVAPGTAGLSARMRF